MADVTQTALVSAPIGGIPVHADLVPSVVFTVLYILLLPIIIYNFFIRKPHGWNGIQIGTVIFTIERIVWFIIRAVQAEDPEKRTSRGLMIYGQLMVGLGFVGIASDAIKLLRCILVNTTLPEQGASKDRPRSRLRYRIFCVVFELAFLGSSITGTIAGSRYSSARTNQVSADKNMRYLIASSAVALALEMATIVVSLMAAKWVKDINRQCCFELAALTLLTIPVPIYRLSVLHIRTNNVFNPISPSARAAFYIVHLIPEWLCVSVRLGTNVRARFGTGRWGDYEMTEYERKKRLEKAKRRNERSANETARE